VAAAAVVALAACINDEAPTLARVEVEASPTDSLLLIVSTFFLVSYDPITDSRTATPLTADTIYVKGDFDEQYSMASYGRVYVHLRNETATPETARLRVFLDGKVNHDSERQIGAGEFMQFLYTSRANF
jgi:hypothetical protein